MPCRDVLELVEPIAAGDLSPDAAVRAHLESCPACAGALASAQRLEMALKAFESPAAPAAFTSRVMQRVRRDSWQSEQNVDRFFNVAVAAAVLLVTGGIVAMLNVETLLVLTGSAWGLLKEGTRVALRDAAPALATYVGAAGLMAAALGMWWWAERRLQF